ncbi:hypothetical protein B7493_10245, partial [Mycobacterium tuberculosis variant bovis]
GGCVRTLRATSFPASCGSRRPSGSGRASLRRVRRAWRPAVRPNRHGWRVAVAGRLAASAALASSQTSRTPWCRSLPLNWRR